jgi:hypothetical protein
MSAIAWAVFDDEGPYLRARTRLHAAERRIIGEWLPYAADSLGDGAGTRGIRAATVVAGFAGAAALFALTSWSAVLAYPFDEGGRPLWSWPAFIPAPVEFGALIGGIGGVVTLFRRAGLTRLNHPAFAVPEVERASQDGFVLAIGCDEGPDANTVLALLAEAGAVHSRLQTR